MNGTQGILTLDYPTYPPFTLQPMCHTQLFELYPMCTLNMRLSLKKGVCHTRLSYIYTHVYPNLMLKNINHD